MKIERSQDIKKLLVVDDNLNFRNFVAEVAGMDGFQVEAAPTAKEFIGMYPAFKPDFIVMDIVMPEMDGIELIQWLVQQNCDAKVIICSGFNPNYTKMAKLLGSTNTRMHVITLSKPVRVHELRTVLKY